MNQTFAWAMIPPIYILLGMLFHVYHFLSLLMKRMRGENLFVFFLFLTVVDILALCTPLLHCWLKEVLSVNLRTYSVPGCRLHRWLSDLVLDLPPWIIVMMTYEKRSFLWYPVPADSQFSRSNLKFALVGLTCLFAVKNVEVLSYTLVSVKGEDSTTKGNKSAEDIKVCGLRETTSALFLEILFPWMTFLLRVVCPFLCLIVYEAFIIRKLRRERHCADRLMSKVGIVAPSWLHEGLEHAGHTVRHTASLALAILLCALPYSLYLIMKPIHSVHPNVTYMPTWELLGTLFYYINYGWLYAAFAIEDHQLLVALRDTWRNPLIRKRGANIASLPPRLCPEEGYSGVQRLLSWLHTAWEDWKQDENEEDVEAADRSGGGVRRDSGVPLPLGGGSKPPVVPPPPPLVKKVSDPDSTGGQSQRQKALPLIPL